MVNIANPMGIAIDNFEADMPFSWIFQICRIANLQHWIFFSFIDDLLRKKALEKSELIFPFSGIKQAQWWHV